MTEAPGADGTSTSEGNEILGAIGSPSETESLCRCSSRVIRGARTPHGVGLSIRLRCVALAGDGDSGDTDSVWRAQCDGTHGAADRDASPGVSRPNVDLE
jgi:hypothetical protein